MPTRRDIIRNAAAAVAGVGIASTTATADESEDCTDISDIMPHEWDAEVILPSTAGPPHVTETIYGVRGRPVRPCEWRQLVEQHRNQIREESMEPLSERTNREMDVIDSILLEARVQTDDGPEWRSVYFHEEMFRGGPWFRPV